MKCCWTTHRLGFHIFYECKCLLLQYFPCNLNFKLSESLKGGHFFQGDQSNGVQAGQGESSPQDFRVARAALLQWHKIQKKSQITFRANLRVIGNMTLAWWILSQRSRHPWFATMIAEDSIIICCHHFVRLLLLSLWWSVSVMCVPEMTGSVMPMSITAWHHYCISDCGIRDDSYGFRVVEEWNFYFQHCSGFVHSKHHLMICRDECICDDQICDDFTGDDVVSDACISLIMMHFGSVHCDSHHATCHQRSFSVVFNFGDIRKNWPG